MQKITGQVMILAVFPLALYSAGPFGAGAPVQVPRRLPVAPWRSATVPAETPTPAQRCSDLQQISRPKEYMTKYDQCYLITNHEETKL